MTKPLNKSKKRILIAFIILYAVVVALCFRVGWIQVVNGEKYSKMATEQQTQDVPIEAKRGVIYDSNGQKLAGSVTCYSVWARPSSVAIGKTKADKKANVDKTATKLAKILGRDKKEIKTLITKQQALVKIDKYLGKKKANQIRKADLSGIELSEGAKRYYPMGQFMSHTLGSVTDDNNGLSGLELEYNQYLSGVPGRWIRNTDRQGYDLSYGDETYYEADDGMGLVLTVDQVIQRFVEKSIETVKKNTHADRVMCIMMDPKTGDILAIAQTPGFDPNNPKVPLDENERSKLDTLSDSNKLKYWNKMWRNSLISDVYEPGSTFKLLTTSMALEEGTQLNEHFNCGGSIVVGGQKLKCWRHYKPHGMQTLEEAVGNSCNPVFVRLAQRVGVSKFYDYLKTFGVADTTGIDFPGEANSLLHTNPGPVELATMGFGQGVAVTPIQLITAVSSLGNDGKLMQPRIVKELVDENGKTVKEFETKAIRQTVSKDTANEMCQVMEYVVSQGGAGTAKVPGYKVGGKTGTAQRAKGNGQKGYGEKYYSSFIGMAPMDDPKVAILVIVDNPKGVKFGSQTAGPGAKLILEDTLKYLELKPQYTKTEEKELHQEKVTVPDLEGKGLEDAVGILGGQSLEYKVKNGKADENFMVKDQYPKAGAKVNKGDTVYLYRK